MSHFTVGILALQGDVREHCLSLGQLGVATREVRLPSDLDDLDAIVLPGGESTTMSKLLDSAGLFDPLRAALAEGMPALGTCAGMILMASTIVDGIAEQRSFGVIDAVVRRNGIGRQIASYEGAIDVVGFDSPVPAVFIRPPVVDKVGADVEVLAEVDGHPVLCRQGRHLVASFHPELSGDLRIHRLFLEGLEQT